MSPSESCNSPAYLSAFHLQMLLVPSKSKEREGLRLAGLNSSVSPFVFRSEGRSQGSQAEGQELFHPYPPSVCETLLLSFSVCAGAFTKDRLSKHALQAAETAAIPRTHRAERGENPLLCFRSVQLKRRSMISLLRCFDRTGSHSACVCICLSVHLFMTVCFSPSILPRTLSSLFMFFFVADLSFLPSLHAVSILRKKYEHRKAKMASAEQSRTRIQRSLKGQRERKARFGSSTFYGEGLDGVKEEGEKREERMEKSEKVRQN
mmetsp:Transcript_45802/g.90209  ORF Transcript_45802/g.90209 Transcript_45802/m.90209 type:complete len:263 (-) Transcript_45802:151-939(-)